MTRVAAYCRVSTDKEDQANSLNLFIDRELWDKEKKQHTMEESFDRTITKTDFQFLNQRCDNRIAQISDQISVIQKRQTLDTQSKGAKKDIRAAICGIVKGESATDNFYGHLLHHITVYSDGRVEITLNLLPARWFYVLDGLADYERRKVVQSDSSVPISVRRPFASA